MHRWPEVHTRCWTKRYAGKYQYSGKHICDKGTFFFWRVDTYEQHGAQEYLHPHSKRCGVSSVSVNTSMTRTRCVSGELIHFSYVCTPCVCTTARSTAAPTPMVDDAALPQPRKREGLVRVPEIDDGSHPLGGLELLRESLLRQLDQPFTPKASTTKTHGTHRNTN